jgi:xanthine dehydrogenase YagS FAD-binding subunit
MKPFGYQQPSSPAAAVDAFAADPRHAMYLGGGTNLIDLMRLGVAEPELLVDVTALPYDRVEVRSDGMIRIGAAVRNSDVAAHPDIRREFPVLAQALLAGASGQLRNLATVGGNLLQRTRCAYFQDISKPCNKRRPGSGCPARDGEHRNLAILGHSPHCVATHPSDMAVALSALDATVVVLGPDGRRSVPMPGLHRLPGDEPDRDTVLEPGELITHVEIPPLPYGVPSAYRKVRERASFAFAVVSVAAALDVMDGVVRDCWLAFGGVAHAPWRAVRAEAALRDAPATEESFRRAADEELAAAEPLRDNGYKVPLARDVLVRTLQELR